MPVASLGVRIAPGVSILVNPARYSRVERAWPVTKRYDAMTTIVLVLGIAGAFANAS